MNNTTAAQTVQPRALILMVTAGQWQAAKDTLSRPNGRSLTTSDTMVFQQQILCYYTTIEPQSQNNQHIIMIYQITANTTLP